MIPSRLRADEVIQVKIFKHPERLTTLAAAALLSLLSVPANAGPLAISDPLHASASPC